MSVIDKMRRAREKIVVVGGFQFTIRRPTDVEMVALGGTGSIARLFPFVVNWESVREIDLIPGGDPHPLPFDADVCSEWLSDRPDLAGPLVEAILLAYDEHFAAMEAAKKN